MVKHRFSKHIDITIDPNLLREVDAGAGHYHASRSAIIRWALQEWLDQHKPPMNQPIEKKSTNSEVSFHTLINTDMNPDKLLDTLQEYEAGRNNRV
jgi:metal-responsive CopG/Arc/MetJ family transcriptional regulator